MFAGVTVSYGRIAFMKDMNFRDILDKIRDLEFDDIFPLHRKDSEVRNLLINVGIYLGAIIFMILLLVLLSHIKVLGVILWIIAIPVMAYALVGMVADLLKFMKYN